MKDLKAIKERLLKLCDVQGVWISRDPKFLWPHVPKCASRSMRAAFDRMGVKLSHNSTKDILQKLSLEELNEYFLWTFIRSPYDRAISVYLRDATKHLQWLDWIITLPILVEKIRFLSVIDDLEYQDVIRHAVPCAMCTHINGKQFLDFVGRYENLDKDWDKLLNHLEVKQKQQLTWLPRWKSDKDDVKHYYEKKIAIEAIKQAYGDDLSTFGYEVPE